MTTPATPLTDGRILSPLATDTNWHAIRAHRARKRLYLRPTKAYLAQQERRP